MRSFPPEARAFPVVLQRNAFGPRLVARAGDVWRGMQDVIVEQSSSVGWTPERYLEADRMFIVRTATVVHHQALRITESLVGRTWVSRARRDLLFTREVRLFTGSDDTLVCTATQEWALLTRALEPTRAGPELYAAFSLTPGFASTALPAFAAHPGPRRFHHFSFRTWHLWMDPHGHVNHPAYLDYCDEGTSRWLASAGLDAQALSPVAEAVHFRAAIGPDAQVDVETSLEGQSGADVGVFAHRILVGGQLCATATTLRRVLGAEPGWVARLEAPPQVEAQSAAR
jgi:acyl-CoA thioesterase FadM